jgi:hypothetical protein
MQILTGSAQLQQARYAPASPHSHDHGHHDHDHGSEKPNPHHGKSLIPMEAVHIAHDVAMIGMNLPGQHHGGGHSGHVGHGGHGMHGHPLPGDSYCGTPPKTGTFDAFTKGGAVNQGLTILSAAAAAGATYHGVRMLQHGHYAHGANHLLMGAGSGVMAVAMATGNHTLHQASSVLMGAHGAMEVGLGVQSFLKAQTTKDKALALTTAAHGACLAAAQLTNNALFTIPLYLGMGAATVTQIALTSSN